MKLSKQKHMRRGLKLPQKCAVKLFRKISKEKEGEGEKEEKRKQPDGLSY